MFSSCVQPPLVSLFSSTGSDSLALFKTRTDADLPADSFICLLQDSSSSPLPPSPAKLIPSPRLDNDHDNRQSEGHKLSQTVLHIQSPTLRTTYIRCPHTGTLGLKHPWLHMQIRNMGKEWSFEVGVVDRSGVEGVIRCSTFQKEPSLKYTDPPVLHLPLAFPTPSTHPLTTWSTISLNLAKLLPNFSSTLLSRGDDTSDDEERGDFSRPAKRPRAAAPVPSGIYSHASYVKVYATCRLRRIWFSQSGTTHDLPWEFQLYCADY